VSGRRALGPGLDPAVVAAVDERLRWVAERENAVVLLAVESGSRAWGFPSPDSHDDCRFISACAGDDYLSLHAPRGVIEFPIAAILDVNGWDLAKALRLLLKGNVVVIEWLRPCGRRGVSPAGLAAYPAAIAQHYLHLGERQRRTYFDAVETKKRFYALRPALAQTASDAAVAAMHFPTLVAQSELPTDVVEIVDQLLARKAATRELGTSALPNPMGRLIDAEFSNARELLAKRAAAPRGVRGRRGQFLLPSLVRS
jgi:uncharacterized protein